MNPVLRNILAVIAGFIVGSIVNMIIVNFSASVVPPPDGADLSTMEGLQASMKNMQPKHFIMPFLAHALGTFTGALVAAKLGATHKTRLAVIVGVLFLLGGIANVVMLPSPLWYTILDLVVAYIPMSLLAAKLVTPRRASV